MIQGCVFSQYYLDNLTQHQTGKHLKRPYIKRWENRIEAEVVFLTFPEPTFNFQILTWTWLTTLALENFFPFEKTICNQGDFPDHQSIRKLTIPSTKLSNTLWHFPDHLETLQTIWKISKPSKIFQDSSETFLTILKLSISSRNISDNVGTFQTSKQLSRPSWNFSEHPKLCRTS